VATAAAGAATRAISATLVAAVADAAAGAAVAVAAVAAEGAAAAAAEVPLVAHRVAARPAAYGMPSPRPVAHSSALKGMLLAGSGAIRPGVLAGCARPGPS
jgi:hypothetical protein